MALPVFERNTQAIEQAQQAERDKAAARENNVFIINPKPGKTSFRVLPAWNEKGVWYHEAREHNFFTNAPTPFLCIEETQGRCPICEYGASLAAAGQEEQAKRFRAKTTYFLNTLIFSDSTGKNTIKSGVMAMQVGVMVMKALWDLDVDVSSGYGDITNYNTGFDINMDKVGSGLQTKYTVKAFPQRTDVIARLQSEGIDPEALSLHDLETLREELSFDDLAEKFETIMNKTPQPSAKPQPVATKQPAKPGVAPAPAAAPAPVQKFATSGGPTIGGLKIAPPPMPKVK